MKIKCVSMKVKAKNVRNFQIKLKINFLTEKSTRKDKEGKMEKAQVILIGVGLKKIKSKLRGGDNLHVCGRGLYITEQ